MCSESNVNNEQLGIGQSTASENLPALRKTGILRSRREPVAVRLLPSSSRKHSGYEIHARMGNCSGISHFYIFLDRSM